MEDVSMSGMFGWIEAGGATTGYNTFAETQSSDVIFRTTTLSNMIAIGNSNDTTAAIYVRENKVGINRTPDSNNDYGLDVYGVQRFSNSNTYPDVYQDVLACHSNINFYSHVSTDDYDKDHAINRRQQTMTLNCLGELKNRLIISDYYAMTRNKVEDVPVKGFYAMPDYVKNGYKLITDARYENEFLENEIFEVQTTKFKIDTKNVDANSNLNLDISVVLAEQSFMPLPIASGDNIDIQFYRNNNVPDVQLFKQVIALEHVVENITILSYAFVDDIENTISFEMVVKDSNSFMFNKGSYYHMRNVNTAESRAEDIRNILLLKKVDRLASAGDLHSIRAYFAHPDPMASLKRDVTPIISQFEKSSSINIYLFPLELPALRDGHFAPQKYPVNITSTDNVIDDKHARYTIESRDTHLVNRVLNPTMRQTFAKDFMMIQEIQSDYTGIWSLEEVSVTSQNTCEMSLRAVTLNNLDQNKRVYDVSRPVSIVPFRLCEFNRIGGPSVSHVSYIPPTERLAVGTFEAGETLTVGGSISLFDHIYFQNRESKHPFRMHYSNESLVLDLDDKNNENQQQSKYVRFSNNVENSDPHVTFNGHVLFESNDDADFYNRVVFSHPHDDERLVCDHFGLQTQSACNVVNTLIDTFGGVSTKFLGLDDMRYKQNTIHDVFIHDISFDRDFIDADNVKVTNGVILETFADYMMDIQVHDIVRIFGSLFNVHIVRKKDACEDQLIQIFLSWYFEDERLHLFQSKNGQEKHTSLFQKQSSTHIIVYRLIASRSNFKTCVHLDIRNVHFEKDKRDKHIILKLLCIIQDNIPFLCIDRFFSFKTSSYALHEYDTEPLDNVVLLKAIKRRGANEYELEFRAVDNITDLKNDMAISNYLDRENNTYLIPLHSFYEADKGQLPTYALREFQFPYPRYTEKNVNIGFSTEEDGMIYLNVRNSKILDKHISSRAQFKVSAIDRVILENGIFEISKWYHFQDHVRAGIKFINNNYIVTKNNTAITYSFNGIPLGVKRANFTNTRHSAIVYADIDRNLFYLLRLYKGHYLYIMDKYNWIWKLVDICENENQDGEFILTLTTTHRIDETDRQDFNTERHIFIIPLRFFTHHALVDDYQYAHVENYIPSRLGVNTTFITETMTVNGDMSCRDKLTFQNEDSLEPFHVKYDKDELNLNDQFLLSGEIAKCKSDLVVDGILSVREVLTSSDRRLKSNIKDTCPLEDLKRINALDIKSFTFLMDALHQHHKPQTGVIAQEMMNLFPNAVVEKRGIIPNIFKKGRVESHPSILYIKCADEESVQVILTHLKDASREDQHVNISMVCLSDEKDVTVVLREAYQEKGSNRIVLHVFETLRTYDGYFIKGTIGTLKMIHQQELFMSGLNAIKALSAEVEQLKNKTILSSTK